MLDKAKVAEKLASKSSDAPAGGPPGQPKVNKTVQKQLAKLVGATVTLPNAAPVQAVAAKPSSKKALKWANKKFGEEGVTTMAQGNGMTPKKWAIAKYAEYLATKPSKSDLTVKELARRADEAGAEVTIAMPPKNDAMQALASGSKKRKDRALQAEAAARDKEIQGAILSLKVSTNDALKNALEAFINGSLKDMMDAFVTLYASRKTDGESDEAVLALDACRKAFDACGLMLTDVETKMKKPAPIARSAKAQAKLDKLKDVVGAALGIEKPSKPAKAKNEKKKQPKKAAKKTKKPSKK